MPLSRINNIFLSLGVALLAHGGIYAQSDTLRLGLQQLFERASASHLQVAADRIKEQMASDRAATARTARLPEITAGLRGGFLGQPIVWKNGLDNATRPESPDWQQNYTIDFTQPVYQGGKIRYAIRKADIEQDIAKLQTATDLSDIRLGLLEQYLELFSLYKQRQVLYRKIEESEHRLKDIRRLKDEGVITNNDVLRSEMQLTNDRLALTESCNSIRIVSQRLDILLGLDEGLTLMPDTALLDGNYSVEGYADYVERACMYNPSLRLLQKETELAENNVRLIRADQLPRLSLTASNTLARPVSRTLADMYNNSWNIGLSFSFSLSSLYNNRHRMDEARRNVGLMRNAEEQQRQNVRMAVQTALLRHREAAGRVEALELSVRQAEENYRIMRNRYMNQLAILTDLLDADNLRLNAELQLTTARTRVVYTYYELQRAAGTL